ncbi:MAG TPA: DNA repair protein RecN, partial [Opitutaceae bacterium]|nr:DNA repair protein RecN [Opitutaceae bacterium]
RRLLKADCQRELLDLYAQHGDAVSTYQERYAVWRGLLEEKTKLAGETQLSPDQIEFLQQQIARIDDLELSVEGVEKLEQDFQRSSQGQALIALAQQLADGISGEEGLLGHLAPLVREAKQLGLLDAGSAPLADRLGSLAVELEDVGAEFSRLAQDLVFDPEQAEELAAKMNTWLELKRKHGADVQAVLVARAEMARRLEAQGDLKGTLAKLEAEAAKIEKELRTQAAKLRATREKAAKELSKIAAKLIIQLGFKKADFVVKIVSLPDLGPCGDSAVEFLFSPNTGEAPLPLNKIASSGELARVMLALKTILADLDDIPLLVFDEVDANVGGEIGRVVGEKMAEIARKHQVLCVTHLPQVAAQAANHLVVTKDQSGERAVVTIVPIHENRKVRVTELARMLGDRTAKSALAHAEELLRD